MSDALSDLYTAIEKARGLMPRGGSSRMLGAVRARYGNKRGGPISRKEVDRRDRLRSIDFRLRQRVKKSDDLKALGAAIEKAKGLMPRGGSSALRGAFRRRSNSLQPKGLIARYFDKRSPSFKPTRRMADRLSRASNYLMTRNALGNLPNGKPRTRRNKIYR